MELRIHQAISLQPLTGLRPFVLAYTWGAGGEGGWGKDMRHS